MTAQIFEQVKLESISEKGSYGIGLQIGQQLADSQMDISVEAVAKGIFDALNRNQPALEINDLMHSVQALQQQAAEAQQAQFKAIEEEGKKFLEENAKKASVKVTDSGLQYEILTEGNGNKPAATDKVRVHYTGTLPDGTVFDSSVARGAPAEFPVNGVIRGWVEALQMMPVGSKWKLTIPHELAYGERGAGASNLHMKFNLQVIPEGQVEVRKELENTDKEKYSNVKFAFQVYAQKIKSTDPKGNETYYDDEYELLDSATYKDSTEKVKFQDVTFNDTTYKKVFYLKPDESAIFSGLKANRKYYVIEVGVNAQQYDKVIINGVEYKAFDENAQLSGTISDVKTDKKTVEARQTVFCVNN